MPGQNILIQATHMFRRAGKGFYFKLPSMRMAALDSTGIELSNELSNVKIDRNLAEIERSDVSCLEKWRMQIYVISGLFDKKS